MSSSGSGRRLAIATALAAQDAQGLAVIAMEQAEEIARLNAELAIRLALIERTRGEARARQRRHRSRGETDQLTLPVSDTPPVEAVRESEPVTLCHVTSRDVTLQPPSSPDPTTPLLTTTARAREAETAEPTLSELLVAGANRGLKSRFGETAGTLIPDAASLSLAAMVEAHGAAPADAIAHVERKARRCQRHPGRIDYFRPSLAEFCVRAKAQGRASAAERALPAQRGPRPEATVADVERAKAIVAARDEAVQDMIRRSDELWEKKGRPALQGVG